MDENIASLKDYAKATEPDLKGQFQGYLASALQKPVDIVEFPIEASIRGLTSYLPAAASDALGEKLNALDGVKHELMQRVAGKGVDLLGPSGFDWASDSTIAGWGQTWANIETSLTSLVTQLPFFADSGFESDSIRMGRQLVVMKGEGLVRSSDLTAGLKQQFDAALVPDGHYALSAAKTEEAVARGIGNATLGGGAVWEDLQATATSKLNHWLGKDEAKQTPEQLAAKTALSVRAEVYQAALHDQLGERSLDKLPEAEQKTILSQADHVAERVTGLSLEEASSKTVASGEHHGMYGYLLTKFEKIDQAAAEPTLDLRPVSVSAPQPPAATPQQDKPTDMRSKSS